MRTTSRTERLLGGSKLRHTIVGVGISLGLLSGGCLGHSTDSGDREKELGDDLDPGGDVGIDPFCDAAWPTTKGNPYPPSCVDPDHECSDEAIEPPFACVQLIDSLTCDARGDTWSPFCVDGGWRCKGGMVQATECVCWGPLDEGTVCSAYGPQPASQSDG